MIRRHMCRNLLFRPINRRLTSVTLKSLLSLPMLVELGRTQAATFTRRKVRRQASGARGTAGMIPRGPRPRVLGSQESAALRATLTASTISRVSLKAPPNGVAGAILAQDPVSETLVGASSDSAECTRATDAGGAGERINAAVHEVHRPAGDVVNGLTGRASAVARIVHSRAAHDVVLGPGFLRFDSAQASRRKEPRAEISAITSRIALAPMSSTPTRRGAGSGVSVIAVSGSNRPLEVVLRDLGLIIAKLTPRPKPGVTTV